MNETVKKQPTPAELRKRRLRHKTWLRSGIQLFFFLSMPGCFAAGFNGVKYIFRSIGAGDALQMNGFVWALIGLGAFTILFGRYFCGYVCAFGSLGDFVWWLSGLVQKKLLHRKKQLHCPEKWLPRLQKLKYFNLAFIVILCALGLYNRLSGTSPWDVFSQLTALRLKLGGYAVGAAALLAILVAMALQERSFCQFLCPMGAVFSLLPVLPFGMLRRNEANCLPGCSACQRQCPVGLKLERDGMRSGECIGCERCAGICPRGNISHVERWWLPEAAPVLLKAAMFFAMGAALGLCRFL